MTEDQSVVGRRRIYYDQNGGQALICSDSEEDAVREVEEKKEFAESEDCTLRIVFGLGQEIFQRLQIEFEAARASQVRSFTSGGNAGSFNFTKTNEGKSGFGDKKQREPNDSSESVIGKVGSGLISWASMAFRKLKKAKPIDFVKKGYNIEKESQGNAAKRKHNE